MSGCFVGYELECVRARSLESWRGRLLACALGYWAGDVLDYVLGCERGGLLGLCTEAVGHVLVCLVARGLGLLPGCFLS